ncbi:bacterial proteasome activator family protein [Nocardioides daeguensis]|uniref:Bacterial proteasome activator n=1 Tax=Nocardioides daeguensis TaxID=908359 RepID=A0ABP6WEQ0_9ACTN|nr:bacterial proteasome activator family protein [Nocardioides daeguensis]MBV6727880.1 bacterial proteasome activator family protein [Nocardioides daeguensis]MCR1775360.1 bacterial proteasome activator family protein [Nocardioides daeguensis]
MSDNASGSEEQILVVGPDGQPIGTVPASEVQQAEAAAHDEDGDDGERALTDLVEQPAKVMRIGSMIRQLLEEVKAAPLDEASRSRLAAIHRSSIAELEQGLAPELVEELERLSLPFSEDSTPSEAELRIAQAQLVGWLEGLFHGIQTAIYAQQMAARAQFEQIRRALPPGMSLAGPGGGPGGHPGHAEGQPAAEQASGEQPTSGGMYL